MFENFMYSAYGTLLFKVLLALLIGGMALTFSGGILNELTGISVPGIIGFIMLVTAMAGYLVTLPATYRNVMWFFEEMWKSPFGSALIMFSIPFGAAMFFAAILLIGTEMTGLETVSIILEMIGASSTLTMLGLWTIGGICLLPKFCVWALEYASKSIDEFKWMRRDELKEKRNA